MSKRSLNVFYTNCCNYSCAHCYVDAGPMKSSTMGSALFSRVVSEACQNGFSRITITGGEPTLFWRNIRPIIQSYEKIDWGICSNAHWAGTEESTFQWCSWEKIKSIRDKLLERETICGKCEYRVWCGLCAPRVYTQFRSKTPDNKYCSENKAVFRTLKEEGLIGWFRG